MERNKQVYVKLLVDAYSKANQGIRTIPLNIYAIRKVKRIPLHADAPHKEGLLVIDRLGFTKVLTLDSLPVLFKAKEGEEWDAV